LSLQPHIVTVLAAIGWSYWLEINLVKYGQCV